jgi:hypothetical protein
MLYLIRSGIYLRKLEYYNKATILFYIYASLVGRALTQPPQCDHNALPCSAARAAPLLERKFLPGRKSLPESRP